jgi:hypothetical protein
LLELFGGLFHYYDGKEKEWPFYGLGGEAKHLKSYESHPDCYALNKN